jgi:hypothetical protein
MVEDDRGGVVLKVLACRTPGRQRRSRLASVALRVSSGSRRRSCCAPISLDSCPPPEAGERRRLTKTELPGACEAPGRN